jgi:hypothetical protein
MLPKADAGVLPMQYYHVKFAFPETERYPTQAVRFPDGLCFPLMGETACTGVEVDLARAMGADVQVLQAMEFPPLRDAEGKVVPAFADFIADLTRRRNLEPKGSLRNLIFKGLANSFYGKMAQGLDGDVPESDVTCPHYAAQITGIIRSALASMVVTISRMPGWRVLSATTDGTMVVGPRRFPIQVNERGRIITDGLKFSALYPEMFAALRQWPAIRLLEQGRRAMGLEDADAWLEIKHAGTEAATYLTRVNTLRHEGVDQHIAWTGFSTRQRDGSEMIAYGDDPAPRTKYAGRLTSYREIMEGEVLHHVVIGEQADGTPIIGDHRVQDMVNMRVERRASLDYDMKRVLRPDGSGETDPPRDVLQVIEIRKRADGIRGRGRGHVKDVRRATPEAMALAEQGARLSGDTSTVVRRHVIRGILQNQAAWFPRPLTLQQLSEHSGMTLNQIKNHTRRSSKAYPLPDTPETRRTISEVAVMFGTEVTETRIQSLLLPSRAAPEPLAVAA